MEKNKETQIENAGRRKAVKTIVGGVTAIAAYNLLPAKWGTPYIESVFLPAHAATSGIALGECFVYIADFIGGWTGNVYNASITVNVSGSVSPATQNLPATIVATPVGDEGSAETAHTTTAADGTFSADITITVDQPITRVNVTTTVEGADGSASCSWSST
ncbi:hypothetical protein JWG39_14770 [Desulforhopalus vacuolatus]|uniref:hypothetical protein n=1 Tax=Desulforhopalus vacuolatus TaxID=40414 RepID=UPI0019625364|nr:hypothetical protein [Desulforhopalus vacuolatus]MBM9521082.1 hypothetical protein [Desulforhopalus vacuolatus]